MAAQTNSSISLRWEVPHGPNPQTYTYWVSWIQENRTGAVNLSTTETGFTLKDAEAGSLFTFTVWAERNGVHSDIRTLTGATGETQPSSGCSKAGTGEGSDGGGCSGVSGRAIALGDSSPASSGLEFVGLLPKRGLSSATRVFPCEGLSLGTQLDSRPYLVLAH